MTWIILNKRLTAIIILCLVVFGQLAYTNYLASKLKKADIKCKTEKAEIVAKHQEAITKAIEKAKPVEIKYAKDKVIHDEKTIEVIKYVPQILKEPYYIDRECFNNEFVSLYNGYINTAKPTDAVQESAKP